MANMPRQQTPHGDRVHSGANGLKGLDHTTLLPHSLAESISPPYYTVLPHSVAKIRPSTGGSTLPYAGP